MKKKELENMGIILDATPFHPNRYWCNATQCHVIITEDKTIEEAIEIVFLEGYQQGIETGKELRSQQFLDLIHNYK